MQCTENKVFHERFLQHMSPNLQFPAELVTFVENILHGKLHFCDVMTWVLTSSDTTSFMAFQTLHA